MGLRHLADPVVARLVVVESGYMRRIVDVAANRALYPQVAGDAGKVVFHASDSKVLSVWDGAAWIDHPPKAIEQKVLLDNDSPTVADTWQPWGDARAVIPYASVPHVSLSVSGWLIGNANGDGIADPNVPRLALCRIEVSFDNGASWVQAQSGAEAVGTVSLNAEDSRMTLGAVGRASAIPTADVIVRAMMRSEGTSVVFANGILLVRCVVT